MRFRRHDGIYRSDVVQNKNQTLGTGPTASRRSVRAPGKRTRREDHALLIVRDEFRPGYSSIGLVATRARLRFTDAIQNKSIARSKPTNYHQTVSSVLTGCLTFRDKRKDRHTNF